jgi:hypothetical protein
MNPLTNILSAFGLASAAGLNAYLPLLVVALAARLTDLIQLNEPWNALTSVVNKVIEIREEETGIYGNDNEWQDPGVVKTSAQR